MSTQVTVTAAEAIKLINKRTGLKNVGYTVLIRPYLPTSENMAFPGCALVSITKAEFIRTVKSALEHFEDRGAKIEMRVPTQDFESFCIG